MSASVTEPLGLEREGPEEMACVVVVASSQIPQLSNPQWLRASGAGSVWGADEARQAIELARRHQPEVAVIELGFRECEGPAVGLQMALVAPHLQTIFFTGADDDGGVAAARALGLERVVSLDEISSLLERLLSPLAEGVRLRRRLDQVDRQVRALSQVSAQAAPRRRLALPEAERRYRETYVRSLLAETGNRREAALRAGVPYTTLCEIMRKLGIADH
jgi:DNA-binding NtrC family response regulator